MCREDPITPGDCRPAKIPPATVPKVLAAPEMLPGSFPPKPLDTGMIPAVALEGPIILLGRIVDWTSLANRLFAVDVIELLIPGNPVGAETEGLISAAIEKSEVA